MTGQKVLSRLSEINFASQSLDDSITSVGVSPEASQVQLDVLRAELVQREKEVAALKQEQLLWQQEKEKEMPSLKDKLNVSEVCTCTMVVTIQPIRLLTSG